jgi:hypothetical protein
MARQHATPVLIGTDGSDTPLTQLPLGAGAGAVSEADIQALIHRHPSCLPIAEIDPLFAGPVPVCTELNTRAGPIDNFMVTPSGLPVLVECKLWRNPEGRREVVGQILDYAKELTRWSSSDLQREASRRLGRPGNVLLELVWAAGHRVDEADFNDALTSNLRRGRFLLLIIGDGIREGVEAIAEYLQVHAGLHFTLGLVELPIYTLPTGERLFIPRILAKTLVVRRNVVATPDGYTIADEAARNEEPSIAAPDPTLEPRLSFLRELVGGFRFSDPDQPPPKPTPKGYLFLPMPAPSGGCWINVSVKPEQVGIWIVGNKNTLGDRAIKRLAEDWDELREALGGAPEVRFYDPDRAWIVETLNVTPFSSHQGRDTAITWLRERMDRWVSTFRPRIRAAVAEIEKEEG